MGGTRSRDRPPAFGVRRIAAAGPIVNPHGGAMGIDGRAIPCATPSSEIPKGATRRPAAR
jgi:hypothetical protein